MAKSYAFRIEKVEPPGYAARPDLHAEFWRAVVAIALTVKDRELAEGLDAFGNPLKPIAPSTRAHRHSAMGPADPNAPPLTPAYGRSRTRSLLTGRAHAREHYALFFWKSDPVSGKHWGEVLGYHRAGKGRLPVRDVIGLSPEGLQEVRRKAQAWWDARLRHVIPPPAVAKVPTPAGAVLIKSHRYKPKTPAAAVAKSKRRIGRLEINGNHYTLQGGSEAQIRRAVANGSFSGFRQVQTTGKYNFGYGRYQPPGGGSTPPPKPTPPPRPPKAPVVRRGKPGAPGEPIPSKAVARKTIPRAPSPVEQARQRQRAANAAGASGDYAQALKQFPDLLPPGPITDRLARYQVGDQKLQDLTTLLAPLHTEGKRLEFEDAKAALALRRASLARLQLDEAKRKARGSWTPQQEGELAAALKAESAAYAAAATARSQRAAYTARRADQVAELIKVDRPVAIGAKPLPAGYRNGKGEPLFALSGEARRNAEAARAWLGKILAAGDVDRLETKWGSRPMARAHYSPGMDHIQLADESPVKTAVHELGHLIEDKLRTAGARAVARGKEFLHHRVGNETPVDLRQKFGAGNPGEMGRKDRFDTVFDELGAYYTGKHYDDATEILAKGLEELYNDPYNLVKNDPEFAKYLLGILDGSLR